MTSTRMWWWSVVVLVALTIATNRRIYSHAGPDVTLLVDRMRSSMLSSPPIEISTYYDGLLYQGDAIKSDLMYRMDDHRGPMSLTEDPFDAKTSSLFRRVDDLRLREPNPHGTANIYGVFHKFNKYGFRDKDYPELPEPGTFRILMLGSSNLLGSQTPEGHIYEALVEERLQRTLGRKVEILNYGYIDYVPLSWLIMMDKGLVFSRKPDLVVLMEYTTHGYHQEEIGMFLEQGKKEALGYPFLIESAEAIARGEKEEEVISWVFEQMLDRCKKHETRCLVVGLPHAHYVGDAPRVEDRLQLIGKVGFPRLSLADIFQPYDLHDLVLHPWDVGHYNARAHAIVADALYKALLKLDSVLALGLKAPQGSLDAFYRAGGVTHRGTE